MTENSMNEKNLENSKKKKVKIEVNKIMNPAFLLGTAFKLILDITAGHY